MPQYQGVWTLPVAARLQSTQQWATDPLFDYTTLLLQADNAPNGAQNNTFADSSSNGFTITRNGNTTQGTFTPFSATGWSNYFDGTGDWLSVADSSQFNLGTSNYTMEFWVYPTTFSAQVAPFSYQWSSAGGTRLILFVQNTDGTYQVYINGSGSSFTSSNAVVLNQWNHITLVRNSNTFTLYINGVSGATTTSAVTYSDSSFPVYIGAAYSGSTGTIPYVGYISNVRVVIGTAIYTSNFSPSSTPLTAVANTVLLTCQSNRFVDNSTNAFAITVAGNPSVQAFSPFAPQYQYTPSVTGGSGYFDGTGDYLSVSSLTFNPRTTVFTVEGWFYRISGVNATFFGDATSTRFYVTLSGNVFYVGDGIINTIGAGTGGPLGAWEYIAMSFDGTTYQLYQNGVRIGSGTTLLASNTVSLSIGAYNNGSATLNGYASGVRFSNTARYTGTTMSIPTAPPTNDANTSLLCNFTNAGIYDGTLKNNLETVGNAQVSTSVVKYGTGSMYFDGTGDALSIRPSPDLQLGSGDWTVEMWVYLNSTAVTQDFFSLWNGSSAGSSYAFLYDSNLLYFYWYTTVQTSVTVSWTPSTATWYHLAFSKSGTTLRFFVNGTQQGSNQTVSTTPATGTVPVYVGGLYSPARSMNGYIDDLRITKGIARYTANFTPPSVALPRQ